MWSRIKAQTSRRKELKESIRALRYELAALCKLYIHPERRNGYLIKIDLKLARSWITKRKREQLSIQKRCIAKHWDNPNLDEIILDKWHRLQELYEIKNRLECGVDA